MRFPDFGGNNNLKASLDSLESQNRMPHAIIIDGGARETRSKLAVLLSAWAVCSSDGEKPCGECKDCKNALASAHSDIYYAKGEGKTDSFSKDEIGRIISDAALKPNQASRKVYIFEECDRRFPVISQNAFLKTLEEPVQDTMFIMTCESSRSFLETVRSRSTVLSLESETKTDEEALAIAKEIAVGIVTPSELELLRALNKLSDRFQATEVLDLVTLLLRDGLALYVGAEATLDSETAEKLCKKLSRQKYLELIDATEQAKKFVSKNVGVKLTGVWLCGEYRRILWQR